MRWNHRVVLRVEPDGSTHYGVHEVYYYDADDRPNARTLDASDPTGETLDELREDIAMFARALERPVLTDEDFPTSDPTGGLI